MAAPPAKQKSSRWGSLLSGAVAGIESRLDTILAEDSEASARSRAAEKAATEKAATEKNAQSHIGRLSTTDGPEGTSSLAVPQQNVSRSTSRNRVNERLQERLAKAVSNNADSLKSPRPSQDISRSASPASPTFQSAELKTPHPRTDATSSETVDEDTTAGEDSLRTSQDEIKIEDTTPGPQELKPTLLTSKLPINPSRTSIDSTSTRPSLDIASPISTEAITAGSDHDSSVLAETRLLETPAAPLTIAETNGYILSQGTLDEHEAQLERLRTDHREELNAHLERIDALQSKLTLLARSTAVSAQAAFQSVASGSADQKIAERDEKIAQLLEEGTKLSATEIKHLGLIKKLRTRISEDEKSRENLRKRLSQVEGSVQDANGRTRNAEAELKGMGEKLKRIGRLERDLEALKAERDGHGITILGLQSRLEENRQRAEEAEKRAEVGASEAKKRAADDLTEQLENAKIEKKILEERLRADTEQVEEDARRKEEQAKISEMELKAEIANLESKIELLKARTEEASSNPTGDSQATLLRQIETLQTQYALASENWQGIESTLTARVSALEKERDEATRRESDVRRKARDAGVKSRVLEEDLESAKEQRHALEQDLDSARPQIQKLQQHCNEVETAFANMKVDFEQERKLWENDLSRKIQEERAKWRLEFHVAQQNTAGDQQKSIRNPDGTSTFGSRMSSTPDLYNRRGQNAKSNALSSELYIPGLTDHERPNSSRRPLSARTPSINTPLSPGPGSPRRQGSSPSLHPQTNGTHGRNININNSGLVPPTPPSAIPSSVIPLSAMAQAGTPSIHTHNHDADQDSLFDPSTSSSPTRRSATFADMVSASTVGTGPSVQLVERMSSAVRRLESEKAALREELARLSAQRDEARGEVVTLMNEAEATRELQDRVGALEKEKGEVEDRYGAALEMLGEKSELVEELRADVLDLKKIYRELVDSTMKA